MASLKHARCRFTLGRTHMSFQNNRMYTEFSFPLPVFLWHSCRLAKCFFLSSILKKLPSPWSKIRLLIAIGAFWCTIVPVRKEYHSDYLKKKRRENRKYVEWNITKINFKALFHENNNWIQTCSYFHFIHHKYIHKFINNALMQC